jgi:acetyl-CoA C-acetyltransferase
MSSYQGKKDIFIVDAVRTAIGRPFKGLKDFTAAQLASFCMKEIIRRNHLSGARIEQVVLGNTVSAGTGQNFARQAVMLAGLDLQTPAFVVNAVCGSGLQSVIVAAQAMKADGLDLMLAGGSESATFCPSLVKFSTRDQVESLLVDGLWCSMSDCHMGRIAEHMATKHKISREQQDLFALASYQKAAKAQQEGKFRKEIIGMTREDGSCFDLDEQIRLNMSLERLSQLPPAFEETGTITAGNSSAAGDAAALILLASENAIKKYQLHPKARVVGYHSIAIKPEQCFESIAKAVPQCLSKAGLKMDAMDLFEIAESFAVQALWTQSQLGISEEKMNIFGGDVAMGHPLGCAGARVLVTLLNALEDQGKKRGLASVCFGSGGAISLIVERL